jgi:hypothetical protein
VVLAGVDEGLFEPITVHRHGGVVGVLLDDREQITQQALLGRGQVSVGDKGLRADVIDLVDRRPGSRDQRRRPTMRAVSCSGAVGPGAAPRAAQPSGRGFAWLLRNRRPSSCLRA